MHFGEVMNCFHYDTKSFQMAARAGAVFGGIAQCLGFDSRLCHWNSSLTQSFRPHYGQRVCLACNRHENRKYLLEGKGGRCVGIGMLPPSYADCLEICEPQTSGTLRACPGLYRHCFTCCFTYLFSVTYSSCPYVRRLSAFNPLV